jgi:1H-pyrrole-2-carbonyl-[peptidyl-carrier protein] brominase
MTGEAGQVLRRLGLEKLMLEHRYPVKHGVRVFGADGVNSWYIPVSARTPEWELTPGTTWQVRRSEFDGMMLKEAAARGATVIRGTATKALLAEDGGVRGVTMLHSDDRSGGDRIESAARLLRSGDLSCQSACHRTEIRRQLR